MATHQEVHERRLALCEALRQACRDGSLPPEVALPSVRTLAQRFGVSKTVIAEAIQELVNEGLLYTVPRMGTFVSRPSGELPVFLLVLANLPDRGYALLIKTGFESQIAALGGAVATVVRTEQPQLVEAWTRELPKPAGIFFAASDFAYSTSTVAHLWPEVPRLHFGSLGQTQTPLAPSAEAADWVAFDDEKGAVLATEHLLHHGYRRIAFLGLNPGQGNHQYHFSTLREQGWRQALQKAGGVAANLYFVPSGTLSPPGGSAEATIYAAEAATFLVSHLEHGSDIDAVLAVGHISAAALLSALEKSTVAPDRWPAIVSFDDETPQDSHVISSVHLPWDEVGRTAADLLVARARGRSGQGATQQRLIAMRLVPRLSCRPNWRGLGSKLTVGAASLIS